LEDRAVVMADVAGVIRFWSKGAEAIFGYAADQAIGQTLDLVVPPEFREAHWSGFKRAMDKGSAQSDGLVRWLCNMRMARLPRHWDGAPGCGKVAATWSARWLFSPKLGGAREPAISLDGQTPHGARAPVRKRPEGPEDVERERDAEQADDGRSCERPARRRAPSRVSI
jgi:PAS domain-containing protein